MLAYLLQVVPFVVPQTAAVTLVFVSFTLLFTARGLRRGQRLAWAVAVILLVVSSVLHIVKGIDFEEAALSLVAVIWLATQFKAFPVLPSRAAAIRAAVVGLAGGAAVLGMATGLAMRADRQHRRDVGDTVDELVRKLGGNSSLPIDFGGHFADPVLVAIGLCVLGTVLWLLLSPRAPAPLTGPAHHAERERARVLVDTHGGGTLDYFALRDDKQWFFSGHSMVAYTVKKGVCLVSPDPIGPTNEREETWVEFMLYVQHSGWSVSVLGAAAPWLPIYESSGLRSVYIGDEAVVDCPSFTLEGPSMKSLRQAHGRVARSGYTTSFHDPATLKDSVRGELMELSTQSRRGEAERGFSMTLSRLFNPEDTGMLLSIARDATGAAQAFIQWVPARDIEGWSLDVMRRSKSPELPNGIMDFLITETIHHVTAEGGHGLGLNFATFRRLVAGEPEGRLAKASQSVLEKASQRTQITTLWKFNAKYRPEWVPRYVVIGGMDELAAQGFVIAAAEGMTEIPVIGRFLGHSGQ
ncbi:MAG: phosphatidylglycerol lysyltransferase domain-containing protein [Micrococcaceae bacterium]|nr:phosphatidylglycerol lysyltransferase domain-containing protein [Micrococcaceae bacterium]